MGIADQVRVLILVDEATASGQALLASLVVVDDAQLRAHYQEIAGAQGPEAPQDEGELRDCSMQTFSRFSVSGPASSTGGPLHAHDE